MYLKISAVKIINEKKAPIKTDMPDRSFQTKNVPKKDVSI